MKILTLIFPILFLATLIHAQNQETMKEAKEAMEKLSFLVGDWKGEGWSLRRSGRIPLVSEEHVLSRVEGHALLVEGIHRGVSREEEMPDYHFEAMALVTYNEETGNYDWRTASSRGGGNFYAKLIGDQTLQWGEEGHSRYIITIKNNTWHETAEISRDGGKTWFQVFEMTLEKQP